MKQNVRKRLKPSRQSHQGRKHKPRGNRGWVYLHPMFPISLTKYKGLTGIQLAAHMKGGGKRISQFRRNMNRPGETARRTWFKLHVKLSRLFRENVRDKLPSPPGTMDSPKWIRLHPEMTKSKPCLPKKNRKRTSSAGRGI